MADNNQARRVDPNGFLENDPFAELTRIMGHDPRAAVAPQPTAEVEFDLEQELMGELDMIEEFQPGVEPAATFSDAGSFAAEPADVGAVDPEAGDVVGNFDDDITAVSSDQPIAPDMPEYAAAEVFEQELGPVQAAGSHAAFASADEDRIAALSNEFATFDADIEEAEYELDAAEGDFPSSDASLQPEQWAPATNDEPAVETVVEPADLAEWGEGEGAANLKVEESEPVSEEGSAEAAFEDVAFAESWSTDEGAFEVAPVATLEPEQHQPVAAPSLSFEDELSALLGGTAVASAGSKPEFVPSEPGWQDQPVEDVADVEVASAAPDQDTAWDGAFAEPVADLDQPVEIEQEAVPFIPLSRVEEEQSWATENWDTPQQPDAELELGDLELDLSTEMTAEYADPSDWSEAFDQSDAITAAAVEQPEDSAPRLPLREAGVAGVLTATASWLSRATPLARPGSASISDVAAPAAPVVPIAPRAVANSNAPEIETVDVAMGRLPAAEDFSVPELPEPEANIPNGAVDDFAEDFAQSFSDLDFRVEAEQPAQAPDAQSDALSGAYGGEMIQFDPRELDEQAAAYWTDQQAADGQDGYPADEGYAYQYAQDDEPVAGERNNRKRLVLVAAAVAGVALVGAAGIFGVSFLGSGGGEPVLVRADSDPMKVRPDEPGGVVVPNQDGEVYQRVAEGETGEGPRQEALISTAEEPVNIREELAASEPQLAPGFGGLDDGEFAGADEFDAGDRLLPEGEAAVAAEADNDFVALAPRRVRTMIVRPDGTLVPREEPEAAVEPAEASPQDVEEGASLAAAQTAAEEQLSPVPEASGVPSAPAPEQVASAPAAAAPVAAAPAPATPPATPVSAPAGAAPAGAATSEWSMQIASQPSPESAQATYQDLARRYGNVLEGRGVNIVRADIEGRGTYYRVRIPAASRDEAIQLCTRYQAAGGSCFVSR